MCSDGGKNNCIFNNTCHMTCLNTTVKKHSSHLQMQLSAHQESSRAPKIFLSSSGVFKLSSNSSVVILKGNETTTKYKTKRCAAYVLVPKTPEYSRCSLSKSKIIKANFVVKRKK